MAVQIEVDPHGVAEGEAAHVSLDEATAVDEATMVAAPLGWTPEQAGQFVVGLWNIGCVLYGPEWAADPRETAGWNYYCAQLLDQVLPRGQGGAVEMGVGLVMVGQGLMTMTMHRWPLIKRGPKPLWVRDNSAQPAQSPPAGEPSAAPPPPAPAPDGESGSYRNPYVVKDVPENPAQPWQGL